jgi:hypothetical protein
MRARVFSCLAAVLAVWGSLASAQERRAPAGAVVVREVQVREVRVDQHAPKRVDDQRPSLGLERPVDPGFISRPIARPQSMVTSPRHSNRSRGRNRFYTFRPRHNVGYAVVVGYPILYPYAYPFDPFSVTPLVPYTQAPPAPNTYSNVDSLSISRTITSASPVPASIACEASAPCGGISFDITPERAQVFVDGVFAGDVDDFAATSAPLLLAPGGHYVEIQLAGYRTASFDVTVVAGEVTPYEGTLERLRLSPQ